MNQMILPTINNFEFSNPSILNIQTENIHSAQHQLFIEIIKDAKSIEKGSFKLFVDKPKTQISPNAFGYVNHLKMLSHQHIFSNPACEVNPYLRASFEESLNPIHQAFWGAHIPYTTLDYFTDTFNRIGENIVKKKCALMFNTQKTKLNQQNAEQKRKFDIGIKKHKQMNCIFIEFPCMTNQIIQVNRSIEETEAFLVTVTKSFLKKCHGSGVFENKLCDMQWRFVKSLDGVPTAQILMYVIGDETNYSSLLHQYWIDTCIEKGLNIFSQNYSIKHIHNYQGNGIASKQWKNLLDCYQAPLEFYRYKANGLSYIWKTYTGNV